MRAIGLLAVALLLCASAASAADFGYSGYVDVRAVAPSSQEKSWMQGGLGKTRYGDGDEGVHLGEIIGEGHILFSGEWMTQAVARVEPEQRTFFDLIEAYLRYRPVSTGQWRFTTKAGMFFAPVSLENTELGWQSPWTITPSALNTWVGEEFRTIGVESKIDLRLEGRTLSVLGGVFGFNDPAGILLDERGWALGDRVTGILERPRIPDAYARGRRLPVPLRTHMFVDSDDHPGWYAGLAWDETDFFHLEVLRYDNDANPFARRIQPAWATDFWSVGLRTSFDHITLLAQGMTGTTFFQPSAAFWSNADYNAAFVLAGWDMGAWRAAARAEVFDTNETHPGTSLRMSEHGNALTFAVNWLPKEWLRLTAEILQVNSTRAQRTLDGLPPSAQDNLFQLSTKLFF